MIYTLSLHDALPISKNLRTIPGRKMLILFSGGFPLSVKRIDRKSTRLNSSHLVISYAVFCLKKKTNKELLRVADLSTVWVVAQVYEKDLARVRVGSG